MSSMRQPRWFWSEDENVQPPNRDGWTLLVDVSTTAARAGAETPRGPRSLDPHPRTSSR